MTIAIPMMNAATTIATATLRFSWISRRRL